MLKDSKTTKYSQLERGDSFLNWDGQLMTVHSTRTTKTGRIHLCITSSIQINPRFYSNYPLKDKIIVSE